MRALTRLRPRPRLGVESIPRIPNLIPRYRGYATPNVSDPGAEPDDYYALLLSGPTPNAARKSIQPQPQYVEPQDQSPSDTRILFSRPLSGPSARERGLTRGEQGLSKPSEPDNCCMSGCVNCVWDTYREEMEEWVAGRRKRDVELHGSTNQDRSKAVPLSESTRSEEDGIGSSDTYAGADIYNDDEAFSDIPVGIREFMKQEKRLREKRAKEKV